MPKSNNRGFVLIFPVLVVAAILLLSFTFSSIKNDTSNNNLSVLSESTSGGDDSDNSGSGSASSGSGSSNSGSDSSSESPKPSTASSSETSKPIVETKIETPKPGLFTTTTKVQFSKKAPELKKSPKPNGSPKPGSTFKPVETRKPEPTHKPEVEDEDEIEHLAKQTPLGTPNSQRITIESENEEEHHFEEDASRVVFSNEIPVNVDQQTNELTVTTPTGDKTLGLLPDDAVKNIINSDSVSEVSKDPNTGKSELRLTINSNGVPVYEVEGIKKGRFLGVFNVNIKKTVQISAIDGAEGSVTVSGFDKFLDLLSL